MKMLSTFFRVSTLLAVMVAFFAMTPEGMAQCNCPSFGSGPSISASVGGLPVSTSNPIIVGQPVNLSVSTQGGFYNFWTWCVSPNSNVTGVIAPCGPGGCNTRVATFLAPGTYTILVQSTKTGISPVTVQRCRTFTVQSGIPNAGFTFTNLSGSNTSILPGHIVRFNNTSTQATGYTWNIPGAIYQPGFTPNSVNPEVTWLSGGFNSNIVMTATGVNGSDNATGSVAILNPVVNPSFTISPANPITGQTVTLINTTTGSGNPGSYSYNWNISGSPVFKNGTNSTSISPQIEWPAAGIQSVFVTACYNPGPTCATSASQSVQVYDPVIADFTVNTNVQSSNSACTGWRVTINNLSSGAATYSWDFGGGFGTPLDGFEPEVYFFTPGNHTVTLTATNGPHSDVHTVQIHVYDPYTITESYTPATNSTCTNGGMNVSISYTDPNLNPTSFSWIYVPTLEVIPNLNTNTINAIGTIPAGYYPLIYTDNIGCGKWVDVIVTCNNGSTPKTEPFNEALFLEQMSSLEQPSEVSTATVSELTTFPNPFGSETTIAYLLEGSSEVRLQVYNNLGQLVETLVDANQDAGEYRVNFDRQSQNLPAGLYFVHLETNGKVLTKKIVAVD